MLQGIKISESLKAVYDIQNELGLITNLNQLNTIVGANNTGKSRFLRTVFSGSNHIKFIYEIDESIFKNSVRIIRDIFQVIKVLDGHSIKYMHRQEFEDALNNIDGNHNSLDQITILHNLIKNLEKNQFDVIFEGKRHLLIRNLSNISSQKNNLTAILESLGIENERVKRIYIPILRGLRPIAKEEKNFSKDDIYSKRTRHDYFQNSTPNGDVFSGLSIYENVKSLLLGDENERNEIKEFESFLSENVFKDKINLIPKYNDDVLHIKIGDELQFPIYRLGDGLQTLIIILFPIFLNRKERHIIFIEEPETHLHPKWQRLLFRAMSLFSEHTYFISTHSSIFINSPQNSIFIISKNNGKTQINFSDIKTEKVDVLKELGYKPNDLFQTNYLLWVEGPSDKIYLNYLIKKLDENLVEEEDYSIMFYGGSSYKHFLENNGDFSLDFIESLNQNYALIMDSDRSKATEPYNKKKKKLKEVFEENNAFFWLTRLREIENYIPFDDFEKAVKDAHKIKNIQIDKSDFGDRCQFIDLDAKPSYKPSIKLSNDLFQKIQKNKNGKLTGIDGKELRKEIENAIQKTAKTVRKIDKLKVAEKLVRNGFSVEDSEINKKLQQLVLDIKKANS
ncbi:Predicted ATP-dependent endonuclease of the OLD family, contains P-loop ATPase and TOPRIM domains [Zunongwangia mangrovi]|uniref:Predicted ATP-dependent endonuclease of the OLD family, contains P-loop ATPase and TOPRIM domains n=1 Tax=Zunongwangia mangrovi TaxID=1334022 RepID=A0A1I1HCB2_9FLAO|nr:ATP-binding protein [Zunongwangia mangrovi]SFC21799.1 Predicted ATP-dependent endonuclease of the OLD family, contains P-loop ATPase and TOPRIM domains [Zunongwangia mangrovi]